MGSPGGGGEDEDEDDGFGLVQSESVPLGRLAQEALHNRTLKSFRAAYDEV